MATVGKAVAVSGVAVAIGLGSLIVFESAALRSMGIGGVVTVLSTLIFGLTVLPAMLGMLGPRVNRLRVPLPRSLRLVEDDPARRRRTPGPRLLGPVRAPVMRHPVAHRDARPDRPDRSPACRSSASSSPPAATSTTCPTRRAWTASTSSRDEFPGGDADPIEVAVLYEEPIAHGRRARPGVGSDLAGLRRRSRRSSITSTEITSVLDPPAGHGRGDLPPADLDARGQRPPEAAGLAIWIDQWVADDVTRVNVFSSALPDSSEGRAVVDEVRATPVPDGATDVLTGGLSSRSRDFMASFTESVP